MTHPIGPCAHHGIVTFRHRRRNKRTATKETGVSHFGCDAQDTAAADLAYAFEHCPRGAAGNAARCVYYLVPVKMLLGELPQPAMLARYGLQHYAPIVQARALLRVFLLPITQF